MKYLLIILLTLPSFAFAKKPPITYGDIIPTEIRSIYDGDTFTISYDAWPPIVGKAIKVRINNIDTPEIRTKCKAEKTLARAAKKFAVEKLRSAKLVELKNLQRGKYFRLIADVFVDGENLGELLVNAGHARWYDGGTKVVWCPE